MKEKNIIDTQSPNIPISPKEGIDDFLLDKLRSYRFLKKEQIIDSNVRNRIQYALNWSQDFTEIKETKINLDQNEKRAIFDLINNLDTEDDPDKIQNKIFTIAKKNNIKPRIFFRLLYSILMGTNYGPRLGPYVLAMGVPNVIEALKRVAK